MAETKVNLPRKAREDSKAVAGVRALRRRLAETIPAYQEAVARETDAEAFCRELRASLRDQRKGLGIDQRTLAERLDMTQSAVSKIENGEGDFGVKTLFRYAQALGLRPVCGFIQTGAPAATEAEKAAQQFQIDFVKETFGKVSSAAAGIARALK
jgi:transcriptional regulator with XRE-family HTH domain